MTEYPIPVVKNRGDAFTTGGFLIAGLGAIVAYISLEIGVAMIIVGGLTQALGGKYFVGYSEGKGNTYEMGEDEDFRAAGFIHIVIGSFLAIGAYLVYVFL